MKPAAHEGFHWLEESSEIDFIISRGTVLLSSPRLRRF
jgi:hypothetical protein